MVNQERQRRGRKLAVGMPKKRAGLALLAATVVSLSASPNALDYRSDPKEQQDAPPGKFFEEVTRFAGIDEAGDTFGASWGDINGDGYPDIWEGGHVSKDYALHLNQGDGTFRNVVHELLPMLPKYPGKIDNHTATWIDYDNDGDEDLFMTAGGNMGTATLGAHPYWENHLIRNSGERFENVAREMKVDYVVGRNYSTLWFDLNQDRLLDMILAGRLRSDAKHPPTVFMQGGQSFEDRGSRMLYLPQNHQRTWRGTLSDLDADGSLDLILGDLSRVWDITGPQFVDITDRLHNKPYLGSDLLTGDFDNDLRMDVYIARGGVNDKGIYLEDEKRVLSTLQAVGYHPNPSGFRFKTNGELSFRIDGVAGTVEDHNCLPEEIFLGSEARHPEATVFALSPDDPQVRGFCGDENGSHRQHNGTLIGFEPGSGEWSVFANATDGQRLQLSVLVESTEPITDLVPIGLATRKPKLESDVVLFNSRKGLVDATKDAGLGGFREPSSAACAADFDNDMDLDIYVVTTGQMRNLPNVFLENRGNGEFKIHRHGHGAEGTSWGLGDAAATADYDNDGFLDLFLTNGFGPYPPEGKGPCQLFRGVRNENHWIKIDLVGTASNRDAIGATVWVEAGGRTQVRERNSGVHGRVQDHKLLHFGLGKNRSIKTIRVRWPTGMEETVRNVSANRTITITESE